MEYILYNGELYHHGIKGQKWGVRRWQNPDGTFNEAGKKRYFDSDGSVGGNARRALAKVYDINEKFYSKNGRNTALASMNRAAKEQQLEKAAAADRKKAERVQAKNAKRQAKTDAIDARLKNAKNASEAEEALRAKVKNDLKNSQGLLKRTISTLTGYNSEVADHVVRKVALQTIHDDSKAARSKMTTGQKAVDFMLGNGTKRYASGGYKNLASQYSKYKSEVGIKGMERSNAKERSHQRRMAKIEERNREINRQHTQSMIEENRRRKELGLNY